MAMSATNRFAIILLGLTILVIALIDVAGDKPIDWRKTYDQRDKIPYGLYITHQKIRDFLGQGTRVNEFTETDYQSVDTLLEGKNSGTVVYIQDRFDHGKQVVDELYRFVQSGGEVFISTNSLAKALLDTLGIAQSYYYPAELGAVVQRERVFSLADGQQANYADLMYPGVFWDLDSAQVTILGYFEAEGKKVPNFISVEIGRGRFILHLEPLMFANYFMLKKDNFNYALAAMNFISSSNIYWYDSNFKTSHRSQSPLRVFLENAGLRQGWYLLLFGLILFLLFKSKREQCAVPVVEPEPNLSKEFARTIATLYYENGSPTNLVAKKIEYFLFDLRVQFQLDIMQFQEDDFPMQLALRTGVEQQDAEHIVAILKSNRYASHSTDLELVMVNREIEEFKRKANIQ